MSLACAGLFCLLLSACGGGVGATVSGSAQLSLNPASVNFGNVSVNNSSSLSVTVTDTGTASLSVSQATVTGAGFSISGLSLPLTVAAGQSTTFSVTFAPMVAGTSTGSISIVSSVSSTPATVSLTGYGVASAASTLSASPTSINFGSVAVGGKSTQTVTLNNTGSASVTVSQASATGTGFKISGLSLPLTLTAGQTASFGVVFKPASSGNASGSVSVVSDASNSPATVSLTGNGVASASLLTVNPTSINFGSVVVNSSSTQTATLNNTGSASVTVSQASATGTGFSISGLSLPLTLAVGQSAAFSVVFAPVSTVSASGSILIISDASNSPATITLSGNGVLPHSATLTWTPSTSTVSGYNAYRGTVSGGPYTKLNTSALVVGTTYTDNTVLAGQTYFFVATAVDSNNVESSFSNEVKATVPTP